MAGLLGWNLSRHPFLGHVVDLDLLICTGFDSEHEDLFLYLVFIQRPVRWMRVDIVSAMSSISAFLTDLKRIQTPHSLFWDFGADKTFTTRWSGGRVQV